MRLEGKIAMVTGAGAGIGRAIALAFAREGANVVIADIDLSSARSAAREVRSCGRLALAVKTDVSISAQVHQCVKKAITKFKRIDILVNNAGIHKVTPAVETAETDWDRIFDVNLKGQFLCSQAVGRQMVKQKGGKVINIASTSAHRGLAGAVAYSASKSGVVQLTRVLAVEWARYNIKVNSISPGLTTTAIADIVQKRGPPISERLKMIPQKRVNKPDDVAAVALFLASSDSDNITGQDIIIDGGLCAEHPMSVLLV